MPESRLDMRLNSTGFTYLNGPLHQYIYMAQKPHKSVLYSQFLQPNLKKKRS